MFPKKIIAFFFLMLGVLAFQNAHAQLEPDRPERQYMDRDNVYQGQSDAFKGTLSLQSAFDINSTAITNSFLKGALSGGFITETMKDNVSAKMRTSNAMGLDFNLGVTGTYHHGLTTVIAGIGHREHFDVKFSRDLFETAFRGNKNYAGKTAYLAPSKVNYFNYQSLYLGISRQLTASNYILGGGLSFIRGGQYQQVNIRRGDLYTQQDGENVQLKLDFDMGYSKQGAGLLPASNGVGLALNLNLARWGERSRFNIELRDLGFIAWKNINTLHADSTYNYDGVEIKNVLNYQNYAFNGINADTIIRQYNIRKQVENVNRWIPFSFNINYTYIHSKKLNVVIGGKYMAFANYAPRLYVRTLYYLRERFMIAPALTYGGYGGFNLELAAVKSFNDKMMLSGSVVCLEYLLIPSKTQGFGMQLCLTRIF